MEATMARRPLEAYRNRANIETDEADVVHESDHENLIVDGSLEVTQESLKFKSLSNNTEDSHKFALSFEKPCEFLISFGIALPNRRTIPYAVVIFLIVNAVVWIPVLFSLILGNADDLSIEYKLQKCILTKRNVFPSQDPAIWADIPAGLVHLNQDPAKSVVYLLLFEEKASSTSSCIVELITMCANNFIFDSDEWLFLNGSKSSAANSEDPAGVLIETLSREMNKHSKVVVVTDIQNVPARLAHGFHFLIDPDNPKVEGAVFIFTLTTSKRLNDSTPFTIAQDELNQSWKELDSFILHPLVTRFTVVVLPVKHEDEEKSCPLKIGTTIEINIP